MPYTPSSLGGHTHRPLNISIDVTDKLPALQRGGAPLTVTLGAVEPPVRTAYTGRCAHRRRIGGAIILEAQPFPGVLFLYTP
jgi:hypothetical protein